MKEQPCDVCEKPLPKSEDRVKIDTKANGTLSVCERCANWIRTHRYAA
jgi:RNase P subunit RPR2